MNTIVFGGFLGSGKTTFLLHVAKAALVRSTKQNPVAILENEIGAVGIDDKLIECGGYNVTTMLAGCACCTLAGELPEAVMGIERDLNPDILLIEATGLALPRQMRENLQKSLDIDVLVCTLVDASRWRRMLKPLEILLRQQLSDADAIVINKVDLIDEAELEFVQESLNDFNDSAERFVISAHEEVSAELVDKLLWRG